MGEKINLLEQNQWEAGPDEELKVPEGYIRQLQYEIVVFGRKKEFTFRCKDHDHLEANAWRFEGVIIDTSKKNPEGEMELKRLSYHPELVLVNVPFMVVTASEASGALDAQT